MEIKETLKVGRVRKATLIWMDLRGADLNRPKPQRVRRLGKHAWYVGQGRKIWTMQGI